MSRIQQVSKIVTAQPSTKLAASCRFKNDCATISASSTRNRPIAGTPRNTKDALICAGSANSATATRIKPGAKIRGP